MFFLHNGEFNTYASALFELWIKSECELVHARVYDITTVKNNAKEGKRKGISKAHTDSGIRFKSNSINVMLGLLTSTNCIG